MFLKNLWDHLEEYLVIIILFFMVIFVFLQVVMRYVFQSSLAWSEELSRYLFVWLVWIGASYAAKERRHLKIEVFINLFSNKVRERIILVTLVIFFLFSIYFSWQGFILLMRLFIAGGLSPAMRIPMFYAYGAVPIGSGLMAIRLFEEIKEVVVSNRLGLENNISNK